MDQRKVYQLRDKKNLCQGLKWKVNNLLGRLKQKHERKDYLEGYKDHNLTSLKSTPARGSYNNYNCRGKSKTNF